MPVAGLFESLQNRRRKAEIASCGGRGDRDEKTYIGRAGIGPPDYPGGGQRLARPTLVAQIALRAAGWPGTQLPRSSFLVW